MKGYNEHFNEDIWKIISELSILIRISGPGCSKLTTSLVNVSLNFQKLISQICQYFLLKKCERLLHSLIFSTKKFLCIWLQSHKTLNQLIS